MQYQEQEAVQTHRPCSLLCSCLLNSAVLLTVPSCFLNLHPSPPCDLIDSGQSSSPPPTKTASYNRLLLPAHVSCSNYFHKFIISNLGTKSSSKISKLSPMAKIIFTTKFIHIIHLSESFLVKEHTLLQPLVDTRLKLHFTLSL